MIHVEFLFLFLFLKIHRRFTNHEYHAMIIFHSTPSTVLPLAALPCISQLNEVNFQRKVYDLIIADFALYNFTTGVNASVDMAMFMG